MKRQPEVSVLIASRGRSDRLGATLEHLLLQASGVVKVEVLLRTDDDDAATLERPAYADAAAHALGAGFDVNFCTGPRGRGYSDLHLFYDQMAAAARGQWLLLYGDDVEMVTHHWDLRVARSEPRTVLDCGVASAPHEFPCVHRSLVEAVGHVALNAHFDTWWYELSRACYTSRDAGVRVKHAPSSPVNDQEAYYSAEMSAARKGDALVLKEYLSRFR